MAQPQEWPIYSYKARGVHPRVSIRSTIDEGELSLRIVDRGELKVAELHCSSDCRVFEGGSLYVGAHVRLGGSAGRRARRSPTAHLHAEVHAEPAQERHVEAHVDLQLSRS